MAQASVDHFLEHHANGAPDRQLGAPVTTLKHLRPLGHEYAEFELETDVVLDEKAGGELPEEGDVLEPEELRVLKVGLRRGLLRRATHIKIRVKYESRPTPEAIERLHEEMLHGIHIYDPKEGTDA